MNQPKAFADEHHFAVKAPIPPKVPLMVAPPSLQVVIFTFGERKLFVDIAKSHLGDLQSPEEEGWLATPVEGDVLASDNRHCIAIRAKLV